MKTLMKALCLTLLFFAYSFCLLGGGMFLEKRILDEKEAEQIAAEQEKNVSETRTPEEYHKYYEIVVSRIITSEIEGLNKEAIKEYITNGYQKRFDEIANLFYPKRKESPEEYGSNFPTMFAGLKKAFDENELNMYKAIILNTSMAVSNDDIELIFKDPLEDIGVSASAAKGVSAPAVETESDSYAETNGENSETGAENIQTESLDE